MSQSPAVGSALPLCLLLSATLASASAHAQTAQTIQPVLSQRAAATLRSTPAAQPIVAQPIATQPIAAAPAADASIDARLESFAKANAGNPKVMSALKGAAAQLKRDPDHYRSSDGLQMRAMNDLLAARFAPAGSLALPTASAGFRGGIKVATGDVNDGISKEESEQLSLLVLMEALRSARAERDSLSEQGEIQQLKMQMVMDRISKMESMLSNVMKKFSDTSSSIIQNMK